MAVFFTPLTGMAAPLNAESGSAFLTLLALTPGPSPAGEGKFDSRSRDWHINFPIDC